MLLELHELQQVTSKSQQDVLDLAKARREAERQQSIRFAIKWGGIVAGVLVLALIAPTRSTISLILYAGTIVAAVLAMFNSPDSFNLKPVGDVGLGHIAPEHEQATDEQVVKLISAAEVDPRVDQVMRPWLESGHPIRMDQFNAVQKYTSIASKASTQKESRESLQRKRAAYLQPAPHVARENHELDSMAMPIAAAAAAALLTNEEVAPPHRHDDAAAHIPGYGPIEISRDNAAYNVQHGSTEPKTDITSVAHCENGHVDVETAVSDQLCAPDVSCITASESTQVVID